MASKGISYAVKLSGMSASLTVFLCTTIIFLRSHTINMSVLLYALSIIIPGGIATGFLGYYIGKTFDSARKKKSLKGLIK